MQVQTLEYNQPVSEEYVRSRFLVNLGAGDSLSYTVQCVDFYWEKPGVIQLFNDGDFAAKVRFFTGEVEELSPDEILLVDNLGDRATFEITVTEYR